MATTQKENKKADNDIRIGMNSRPRNVIKYSSSIIKEKDLKELKFSAVGGSIGRLLDIVEVLKIIIPNGVYQQNRITSVAYQTVDSNNNLLNQRLYPKLEVILSKEEPKVKTEGYQEKLSDEQVQKIKKIMDERKQQIENNRGSGRGRRGGARGTRGRRGGFRGRRGGFRGRRDLRGGRGGNNRPRRGGVPARGRGRPRGRGAARGAPRDNKGRGK